MIKIQIGIRKIGKSKKREFTVYLRITDGIEPIFMSSDFNEVVEKIRAIRSAIPQTQAHKVTFIGE